MCKLNFHLALQIPATFTFSLLAPERTVFQFDKTFRERRISGVVKMSLEQKRIPRTEGPQFRVPRYALRYHRMHVLREYCGIIHENALPACIGCHPPATPAFPYLTIGDNRREREMLIVLNAGLFILSRSQSLPFERRKNNRVKEE